MEKLKPCPFCGCKNIDVRRVLLEPARLGIHTYKVCCFACAAQIYREKQDEAIETWNRRFDLG